jgi:(p)ppGpp synthase/HD superfamily hydrolase
MKNNYTDWIIERHSSTNHMYDAYLPYEFHLRMVVKVAEQFLHLISDGPILKPSHNTILMAAWGHDLIEDTRTSYNDVKEILGDEVADIVYALTNEKGKNRKQRANDKYYEGIRNTKGAVFVKLCDRIANVQYSKMTESRMFEMYKKENHDFMDQLGYDGTNTQQCSQMFEYLTNLFN